MSTRRKSLNLDPIFSNITQNIAALSPSKFYNYFKQMHTSFSVDVSQFAQRRQINYSSHTNLKTIL